MKLQTVALTHKGLVRESNQDTVLSLPESGLFAIADGMGGEQAGDEASAQVAATLNRVTQSFFQQPPNDPIQIELMLREGLLQANQDVIQIGVREPRKRGLGSTASVLCLHRGLYFTGQVGDSRIYLVRQGNVQQLTRDHTLVWMLYEQGNLTRDQLEHHPERHLLTQCIGSPHSMQIDVAQGRLCPGDLFLICSDGLTGYAEEERTHKLLLNSKIGMGGRATMLLEEALQAGGGDNVSLILVRVEQLGEEDNWRPMQKDSSATPTRYNAQANEGAETIDDEIALKPRKSQKLASLLKLFY